MILFDRFLAFFYLVFLLFLKAKLKTAEMWESDGWLYIRIVRIIKSEIVNMNLDFKIQTAQEHFWKKT